RAGDRQIEVRDVFGGAVPPLLTPKGRSHPRLDVELGDGFLIVRAGRHLHLARWDRGPLKLILSSGDAVGLLAREGIPHPRETVRAADTRGGIWYDPRRFVAMSARPDLAPVVEAIGPAILNDTTGPPVGTIAV